MADVTANWIAADWGTSRLRVWAMGPEGVRARATSDAGMAGLTRDGFEPALLALVERWLAPGGATPVIACGMVGSRQGWAEAPYAPVPCPPLAPDRLCPAATADARLRVGIVAGLRQDRPADVMRGEETQIAGYLAKAPGFDGVLCLPGTHTKWVRVSAGEVVGFQTLMTGELFALLSQHSVLRHDTAGTGWDAGAFAEAAAAALARPERLAAALFAIRAEALLGDPAPGQARARLSGALIGAELAAARAWWLGQKVVVIGAARLGGLYATALAAQGVVAPRESAETMTLAGLALARAGVAVRG